MHAEILAPAQTYVLLAIVATVGSITAAMVQSLFPRRIDSAVIPEQSLTTDRRIVNKRRFVVGGFGLLLVVVWTNIPAIMLCRIADWTPYHWWHFVGLLLLLVVFTGVIVALSDRLNAVSTSFLESPSDQNTGVSDPTPSGQA